jgi:hypothetical protein
MAAVRPRQREMWFHCAALLIYTSITVVYLAPLARRFTSHIAPDAGDPVFVLYVMSWVSDRTAHGFQDPWSPPFFHPAKNVLALSDHMIGPALLFGIIERAVSSPAAAYNALFLSSFILAGWTSAWVYRRAGCSAAAALLAGGLFTFAPYRWDQQSHLQVLFVPWIPLALWFWHRFLETTRWKEGSLFFGAYALHVSGGSYLAYLIHFPLAVLLGLRAAGARQLPLSPGGARRVALVIVACGALMLALNLPYLTPVEGVAAERGSGFVSIWSATALSYATPSVWNWLYEPWARRLYRQENALFPGILCTVLAVIGLLYAWRQERAPSPSSTRAQRAGVWLFLSMAAVAAVVGDLRTWRSPSGELVRGDLPSHADLGVLFAIGIGSWALLTRLSSGHWPGWRLQLTPWWRGLLLAGTTCFLLSFPVVWVPLAKALPGLDRMRVPTRMQTFVLFALCGFAARAVDLLLARWHRRPVRSLVLAALSIVALLDCAPRPLRKEELIYLTASSELRPVYHWLASAPAVRAIAELPAYGDHRETSYLYYSLHHRRAIVNGFSGHIPVGYHAVVDACAGRAAITRPCLDSVQDRGATHLVLHLRPPLLGGDLKRRYRSIAPAARSGMELVWSDRTDQVYRIRDRSPSRAEVE